MAIIKKGQPGNSIIKALLAVHEHTPRQIKEALGDIAVSFNLLEFSVSVAIWELLGLEKEPKRNLGKAVTARLGYGQKVNMLGDLIEMSGTKRDKSSFKLLKKKYLNKVNDDRNVLLHATYMLDDPEAPIFYNHRLEVTRSAVEAIKKVDVQELHAARGRIDEALAHMEKFRQEEIEAIIMAKGFAQFLL